MALVDVKAIQEQAHKEHADETTKAAVGKLKDLYKQKEKAQLVVRNIDREIESYLRDISDNVVYQFGGVDPAAANK